MQFEIAHGDRIEHQRVLLLVVADGVEMQREADRRAGLRVGLRPRSLAQVVQQRAGGANGLRMAGQAEAFEAGTPNCSARACARHSRQRKTHSSRRVSTASAQRSAVPSGLRRAQPGANKSGWRGKQDFARAEQLQFVAQLFFGAAAPANSVARNSPVETSTIGQADGHARGAPRATAARKLFSLGSRTLQVGGGAGRDHADHFAAHQFFAGAGLLHLVADGDFVAGAQQPRDVGLRGVIRNAAHGDGLAAFAIAGGQRDLQLARRRRWRPRRRARRNRPGETAAARAGSAS